MKKKIGDRCRLLEAHCCSSVEGLSRVVVVGLVAGTDALDQVRVLGRVPGRADALGVGAQGALGPGLRPRQVQRLAALPVVQVLDHVVVVAVAVVVQVAVVQVPLPVEVLAQDRPVGVARTRRRRRLLLLEVKAEKYLTPEQWKKMEEDRKNEEERRMREKGAGR